MMASEPLIVQAIYSFKGTNNDELCFKKGDVITVTQKDDGWWEGTLNDKTGWFPSNYVKESKDAPKPVLNPHNQYKSVVLKDLIDSEKAHVTELEGLVANFLQPLEKSSILSPDEYKQLTGNILDVLDTHQQLLKLIEHEHSKPGLEQRVGNLFITWAPRIKTVHQTYCALHPRAVCILDKYKDELTKYMESKGAASPGVLVLTTLLSKPFRRLDKYSGMLQELERHVEECHVDRGDTQRSVAVYKEIATTCSATRRQKELELQVLTGPVRGWEGPSLTTLGDIVYMGSVAVGPQHHDRYFVLFPNTLLILSVSHRLSAFIYEGKLPVSGLIVTRLDDNDLYKNAFEISAPMIEKRIAVCQSKSEANHWCDLLKKQPPTAPINHNVSSSIKNTSKSTQLDSRGYCNRTSVLQFRHVCDYKVTYPPHTYPPCAPFASLTKYYSKCIKTRVINSKLLKRLLYPEYLDKPRSDVKIRQHRSECVIVTKAIPCRVSVINCDSSSESDSEAEDCSRIRRQNAIIETSSSSSSSGSSSSSNPFGYIRYYNPERSQMRYESVLDYGEPNRVSSNIVTSTATVELHAKESLNSGSSSCITLQPFGACENLLNLDENAKAKNTPKAPTMRQSCPTKLVGNKFNNCSLTTIYIPSWSNSDTNISCKANFDLPETDEASSTTTHSSSLEFPVNTLPVPDGILAEILYNQEENVIKPPSMFRRRRSSIQINRQDLKSSSRFVKMSPPITICQCVECHSPRSSDSGMAGSCSLNSPDLANAAQNTRNSEIVEEARDFEAQCPCTSPFNSTPSHSSPASVTGHSGHTSVTSSLGMWPMKIHSRVEESPSKHVLKSKSMSCVSNESTTNHEEVEDEAVIELAEDQPVYKSGLYAHWWLKAKIPQEVLRGIYQETRANVADISSTGSHTPSPNRQPH